jgi:hypothetical protein
MISEKQLPILHRNLFKFGIWSKEYINKLIEEPSEPEDYPNVLTDLENCLKNIKLKNKKILVIGSITPWIECFLLKNGAEQVYITDVNFIEIEDSRIIFVNTNNLKEKYDIIVSFSSVEHIGLGRYGDPIDEDGDIKFMAESVTILKDAGIFLLGVPVAEEYKVDGNWHRIYDNIRLNLLLESYKIVMSSKNNIILNHVDFTFDSYYEHDWQNQPFIVLTKKYN